MLWLAAPLLLVALLLLEENVRGRWMLWRVEREMGGWPSSIESSSPKPASDGALAVLAAAAELQKSADDYRLVSAGPRGLMKLRAPGTASCAYREPRFPSFNAYRSLNKEASAAADDWLLANTQLAAARGPLDRLRAALKSPGLALDSRTDLRIPNHANLFYAHRWLMSEGVCALHAGDLDATIDSIAASCALARLQRTDRQLESQKTAELTDVFATLLIWEALQADGWTDERLARLQQSARDGEQLTSGLRAFEAQPAFSRRLFDTARKDAAAREIAFRMQGREVMEELFNDNPSPSPSERGGQLHSFLWSTAWSHQDQARSMKRWGAFLKPARQMGVDHSWTAFAARYPKRRAPAGGLSEWRWAVSDLLSPSSARYVLASLARNATERQMALTAIAIKRWELSKGSPPPSLEALGPRLLPERPIDYMNGQPLHYYPSKDGCVLYSVGLDGKDDGGDPTTATGDSRVRSLWGGRDAVWPMAVAAKE